MQSKLLRAVKGRFGIDAPRLSVRTRVPWPLRVLVIIVLVMAGLLLGQWVFETGARVAGFERGRSQEELAELRLRTAQLQQENAQLKSENLRKTQQIEIEQTTHTDLAKSLRSLQDENAALREDNAVIRNLLAPNEGGGPAIYRFNIERNPGSASEYRYRLLLLKADKKEQTFHGRIQFLVSGEQEGKKASIFVPQTNGKAQFIAVEFKYYQRLEGVFQLPPAWVAKQVQVRLFEAGAAEPKWTKSITL